MANRPSNDPTPIEALKWLRSAGVDLAVGDEPADKYAESALAPAKTTIPMTVPAPSLPAEGLHVSAQRPAGDEADPRSARELAASASNLAELENILRAFDGCGLKRRATQLVFADGNPDADVMLVGEAPGSEEDLKGKPFVGRSGQLLDRMLAAIGLDRTSVYIANTVPWRPPGNRTPTPSEIAVCLPFLHRQIEFVSPKFIMTLGAPAAQTLFETRTSISRLRGQWRDLQVGALTIRAIPTMHPAYLLRVPKQKKLAWQDLLSLRQALDGEND